MASQLLDIRSFEGVVHPADGSTRMASQAAFHGCAVVTEWPRAEVEALLPAPLVLARSHSEPGDRHPVVFLLGDQRQGAALFGGVTLPTPVVYEEFSMAVPFVRHREGEALQIFVPRMICSFFPAMWTGNLSYGFGKRMGRVQREGPFYSVSDTSGSLLFRAQVEVQDRGLDAPNRRQFEALRMLFELPVFGIRPDGSFVSSYWDFDVRQARVRPADAIVTIAAPFASGLRLGEHADIETGSFEIDGMLWRLSWPLPGRI